ncbi:uncharacterized protein fip1l1a [Amphiprion ocellaris]|uniref:uncharacterized protein fip1l1a n=1 Tax=Amphiprion ocellaris TaxID=80972 RepID=UPI0024116E1A|nr:uncharacterized protein fip1l1a [Amphiprion ocellaris]XP_054872252.1 uncharacterized protein fip1l1a [Amphiprion ocellaris]
MKNHGGNLVLTCQITLTMVLMKKAGMPTVRSSYKSVEFVESFMRKSRPRGGTLDMEKTSRLVLILPQADHLHLPPEIHMLLLLRLEEYPDPETERKGINVSTLRWILRCPTRRIALLLIICHHHPIFTPPLHMSLHHLSFSNQDLLLPPPQLFLTVDTLMTLMVPQLHFMHVHQGAYSRELE